MTAVFPSPPQYPRGHVREGRHPNGAVKLPAPLALLAGSHSFSLGLSGLPTQHQSAPQLTAGVGWLDEIGGCSWW
jgi:hypothetical protein